MRCIEENLICGKKVVDNILENDGNKSDGDGKESNITGRTLQQHPWNDPLPLNYASRSRHPHHYPAQPGMHGHFAHNLPMKLEAYPDVETGQGSSISIGNLRQVRMHDTHVLYPQASTSSFITAASP